jgi:DNA-3-methyladenine glycosylase II
VPSQPVRIRDAQHLADLCHELADREGSFQTVVGKWGVPPLWRRKPGFESLIRVILEQHVSLDSARGRLLVLRRQLGAITPAAVAAAGEKRLQTLGITKQKSTYLVAAADAVQAGRLHLARLEELPDEKVAATLLEIRGLGPWSVGVYLNLVMRRIDIWPQGDVALLRSFGEVFGDDVTNQRQLLAQAEAWRPHRSVAARLLWHSYLSRRGRSDEPL